MGAREVRVDLPEPFPPGARKLAFVQDMQIVIFNLGGTLYAIENSCPHAGASLASGKLEGNLLRCPSHGLKFDLVSGCLAGAQEPRLRRFAIKPAEGGALLTIENGV